MVPPGLLRSGGGCDWCVVSGAFGCALSDGVGALVVFALGVFALPVFASELAPVDSDLPRCLRFFDLRPFPACEPLVWLSPCWVTAPEDVPELGSFCCAPVEPVPGRPAVCAVAATARNKMDAASFK